MEKRDKFCIVSCSLTVSQEPRETMPALNVVWKAPLRKTTVIQYKQTKYQNQICLSFSTALHLNMDAIMHEQFAEKTEKAKQSVFEVSASF